MACGVKDPGASAGVRNPLRGTAGPNTTMEPTVHSVRFLSGVGLYDVDRASAWASVEDLICEAEVVIEQMKRRVASNEGLHETAHSLRSFAAREARRSAPI
jgi:hypothetical protein